MADTTAWWTCKHCGERVPVSTRVDRDETPPAIVFEQTSLTDVFAHLWAHQEAG